MTQKINAPEFESQSPTHNRKPKLSPRQVKSAGLVAALRCQSSGSGSARTPPCPRGAQPRSRLRANPKGGGKKGWEG